MNESLILGAFIGLIIVFIILFSVTYQKAHKSHKKAIEVDDNMIVLTKKVDSISEDVEALSSHQSRMHTDLIGEVGKVINEAIKAHEDRFSQRLDRMENLIDKTQTRIDNVVVGKP